MNTQPWIDRIKLQCPQFRFVGGAIDLNEHTLKAAALPAAFVVPLSESADPGSMLGRHQQRVTQQWAVLTVFTSIRHTTRDDTDQLSALRLSLRNALTGWAPNTDTDEPVDFETGQLLDAASSSAMVWEDVFTCKTFYVNG